MLFWTLINLLNGDVQSKTCVTNLGLKNQKSYLCNSASVSMLVATVFQPSTRVLEDKRYNHVSIIFKIQSVQNVV